MNGGVAGCGTWPQADFWLGRSVLLTGHTGFKGSWLALWLLRLGARVTGVALAPHTDPNLFSAAGLADRVSSHVVDIRDQCALERIVAATTPEVVFHLAAQPLVRDSYLDPVATFASNVMGTVHVLEALRRVASVRVAVMVTTDKVYANRESIYPFRESDRLGGHDPYSASKAACEIIIASYVNAFFHTGGVAVASARAGNVIGGGDWARDRLIPDAIRAWQNGQPLVIRSVAATRPWQHVLDPLRCYLVLAEYLWSHPDGVQAYNFGPGGAGEASVMRVVSLARAAYGSGEIRVDPQGQGERHEAGLLSLEVAKARHVLGIEPRWRLEQAVARTMSWYRAFHAGADAAALCLADLDLFEQTA